MLDKVTDVSDQNHSSSHAMVGARP